MDRDKNGRYITGASSWNKGLTKETNASVRKSSEWLKRHHPGRGKHRSEEIMLKMKPNQFKKGHKINVGRKMPKEGVMKAVESRRLNGGYLSMVNKTKERMAGKTYEEIYGNERAIIIKEKLRVPASEEKKVKIRNKRSLQIIPIKDTSIEIKIQNYLKLLNLEFYAHQYMNITHKYRCDIYLPIQNNISQKTIIECDGDYWHGNSLIYNEEEFNNRQKEQKERDIIRTKELIEKGFRVIRLWEHEIKKMELNKLREVLL